MKYQQSPGQQIKLARVRLGITQQQLTDRINELLPSHELIERTMLSRWEKDKNYPRTTRRTAIEQVLNIQLAPQPLRRETYAAYLTSRDDIVESVIKGLEGTTEIWLTSAADSHSIWNDDDRIRTLLDKLRRSPGCKFKELIYVRSREDFDSVRTLADKLYPNYSVRIRVAPGHPFPVIIAPNSKYGLLLSGFHDELTTVGLELDGQIAGFNEQYLHRLWLKASAIYEDGQFNADKYGLALQVFEDIGGVAQHQFEDRVN